MVNKKIVIICTIIAIIVTSIIIAIEVKKFKTENLGGEEETASMPQSIMQNQIENEIEKNEIEESNISENETIEPENTNIEENIVEENNLPNSSYQGEEETKEDDEASVDYSEKALELAKTEWGEDDTVYFTIDNQSENIFTISVRSKTTTQTLAEYEVNVIDETVNMM